MYSCVLLEGVKGLPARYQVPVSLSGLKHALFVFVCVSFCFLGCVLFHVLNAGHPYVDCWSPLRRLLLDESGCFHTLACMHRNGLLGMTNSAHNAVHKKNDDALPITRYAADGTANPVEALPPVRPVDHPAPPVGCLFVVFLWCISVNVPVFLWCFSINVPVFVWWFMALPWCTTKHPAHPQTHHLCRASPPSKAYLLTMCLEFHSSSN